MLKIHSVRTPPFVVLTAIAVPLDRVDMLSRTGEIADRKRLPVNIDKPAFGDDEDAHPGSLSDGRPWQRDQSPNLGDIILAVASNATRTRTDLRRR